MSGSVLDALAHPTVANPLAAYSGALQTAGQVYQLKEQQAQQAWGNALQQSTGPDGTVDYNKARSLAAQNPLAAMGMMRGLAGSAALSGAAQDQGQKTNAAIGDAITAAMKAPDDQLHAAAAAGLTRLIVAGAIPQDKGVLAAMQLPNDPVQLRQRLEQIRLSLAPPEQRQTGIYGVPGQQTGPDGKTMGTLQSSQTGAVSMPAQQGAPLGFTPQQLASPVDIVDPATGQKLTIPFGEMLRRQGVQLPQMPGAPDVGTGRPPPALRNPAAVMPPPAAPVVTGLSPAQQAQQAAQGATANTDFRQEAQNSVQAQSQNAVLGNMLADTSQFVTGPGIEGTKKFKQIMTAWSPKIAGAIGVSPDSVAANESFDKLVNQIVTSQQGAQTDARMAVTEAATPHSGLTPGGVDMIIRQLQGNSDYLAARARLANAYPDKTNFAAFQQSIKDDLDPRAFQYQRMTIPQRRTYFESLDAGAKAKLKEAYGWAEKKGLISNP